MDEDEPHHPQPTSEIPTRHWHDGWTHTRSPDLIDDLTDDQLDRLDYMLRERASSRVKTAQYELSLLKRQVNSKDAELVRLTAIANRDIIGEG
jgi:hypothetical protein